MFELISRQEAIGCLDDEIIVTGEQNAIEIQNYIRRVVNKLNDLPAAEPQKGKWIRTRTMTHDGELYCDQCEQEHPEQKIIWKFCPNCGASMEEGKSDDN